MLYCYFFLAALSNAEVAEKVDVKMGMQTMMMYR